MIYKFPIKILSERKKYCLMIWATIFLLDRDFNCGIIDGGSGIPEMPGWPTTSDGMTESGNCFSSLRKEGLLFK